jgi:cytoskeleton protein RodZ
VDAVSASVPVVEKVSSVSVPSSVVAEIANSADVERSEQAKTLVEVTSASHSAAAVATSNTAENTPLVQPVVAGNDKLRLKFRQDSWVQVKKENGTVLTSHLAKAGTEEVFEVKETLQLRLGNAAGVDASLRGNAMDITTGKDSNVVNLIVK